MNRLTKTFTRLLVMGLLLFPLSLWGTGKPADVTGPVSLKIMQTFPSSFVQEDNPVVEYIEKKLNLVLEYEIPPRVSYTERQQLVLASGDFPDVMMFTSDINDPNLLDAVDGGLAKPVTEWVKKAPNIQKYTNPISWRALYLNPKDNEIYAVPGNTIVRLDGFHVRKDWLDKVGVTLPADYNVTLDGFADILKRFTKNDPDGNGKDDTYGITSTSSDGNISLLVDYPFGVSGNASKPWWQKVDNEKYPYMPLIYSKSKDNFKKALEYNRMLWEKGYIDQEWLSITGHTALSERMFKGKAGVWSSFGGHIFIRHTEIKKNNPDAESAYISGIKNDQGLVRGPGYGSGLYRINVVLVDGKQEAAVKYFDFLLSDEGWDMLKFGLEGFHFNMVGGKKEFTEEYTTYARTYLAIVRRYNDASFFMSQDLPKEERDLMTGWVDLGIKSVVMSEDFGFRPPSATAQSFIDYKIVLSQAISKIVLGQMEIDEWDSVLDGWYKAGGDDYLREVNEHIAKSK